MSESWTINVSGSNAAERAAALAGALAEAGVPGLAWAGPGAVRRRLGARTTDLPGVLAAAGEGVLEDGHGSVRAEVSRRGIIVTTTIAALADALGRAGHDA